MFSVEKRVERDPLVGTTIANQFVLTERLGCGSLSVVYKAKNKSTGRHHAIKFLKRDTGDDELARVLFEREVELTKNLVHPNIAAIVDSGIGKDGTPFLVMDFIDGPSLSQMIDKVGPIDPVAAVKVIVEICQGMSYAHSKGVLHCDLKPSNIMIHRESTGHDIVKVIDFGIAKLSSADSFESRDGVLGSLCYMSPERLQGHEVDIRSDIYSVGCLIHEILFGQPPFVAEEPKKIVYAQVNSQPEALLEKLTDASSGVVRDAMWHNKRNMVASYDRIIARCLEKDPGDRYQSMAELKSDVERVIKKQHMTTGKLKSTVTRSAVQWDKTRARKADRRNALMYAMAVVAMLLVGLLGYVVIRGGGGGPLP